MTFGKTEGKLTDLEGDNIAVLSELATQRGWKLGTTLNAKVGLDNVPLKIVALYEAKDLLGNYIISTATLAKQIRKAPGAASRSFEPHGTAASARLPWLPANFLRSPFSVHWPASAPAPSHPTKHQRPTSWPP